LGPIASIEYNGAFLGLHVSCFLELSVSELSESSEWSLSDWRRLKALNRSLFMDAMFRLSKRVEKGDKKALESMMPTNGTMGKPTAQQT
jgi:hypothetical protein